MKRIYLLLTMTLAATFLSASVGFVVPDTVNAYVSSWTFEKFPYEGYNDGSSHGECPERTAFIWYSNNCTSSDKRFFSMYDIEHGALLTDGKPIVTALWFNLDRSGSFDDVISNLLNRADFKNAVAAYIKAGGNVLLTKQAARLVLEMGRCNLWTTVYFHGDAYSNTSTTNYQIVENVDGETEYKLFSDCTFTDSKYSLSSNSGSANRECVWNFYDTYGDPHDVPANRTTFERDYNCKILAFDGIDTNKGGMIEFYPKGDFKGTILVIGTNAYDWGEINEHLSNVKQLTQNALDYLTETSELTVSTPSANPVICSQEDITVSGDYLTDFSYATTDANVANINADGHIYYNHFGEVTFTVHAVGDGIHIPKNISASVTRTVTGGDPAKYGYVLTYSLHTLDAEKLKPDYTAAKWFYDNYVSQGTGCFINPTDYSSSVDIPDAIKVLWVHSDKWNLAPATYYAALGGDDFRDALKNYIIAGGNAFLSKQATRLIKDIGRAQFYPCYEFAGSENSDDASDTWYMTDDFKWVGTGVSRHWHRAFRFMTGYRTDDNVSHWPLVSGTSPYNRTDHWYLWGQTRVTGVTTDTWGDYGCVGDDCGFNKKGRLTNFESKQQCTILGGWGHTANLDAVGMAEFYPATVSATDFKGSVITMGLGAYQWTTDNTCANMAKLTKGVLEYLTDVPFVIHHNGDSGGDPREVNNYKETYAGGNIGTTIEYRMKVNALDQWYSLYLPFTVDSVQVWDGGDNTYYDLVPYYRTGGKYYTGHYIIRTPERTEDLELADFGNWNDPTTSAWLPTGSTPYIIQWHDSYFTNKYISFYGHTDSDIPTSMTAGTAPSTNNVVNICGNDAMKNGSVAGAYLLEGDYGTWGAWLRAEDPSEARTILPFECYILASEATRARYRVLRRGMSIEETATGWEDVINSERKTCVEVYTITGYRLTQYNDCSFSETAQRLNAEYGAGMYILRTGNESVKLMLEGGK